MKNRKKVLIFYKLTVPLGSAAEPGGDPEEEGGGGAEGEEGGD
jgi:hypothetical protein